MLRRISNASSSFGFLSPVVDRRDSKHSSRSQDGALKTATPTTRNARSSSIATSNSYNSTIYEAANVQESLDSAHALLIESIQALQGVSPSAFAERLVLTSQISALLAEYPETRNTFRLHGGFLTCISVASSLELPTTSPAKADSEPASSPEPAPIRDSTEDSHLRLALLSSILTTLARSFEDNYINRHAFKATIGFDALLNAIRLSNLLSAENTEGQNDKLLGILLAVMLDPVQERSAKELFVNLRQVSSAEESGEESSEKDAPKDQLLNEELDNFLAYPARLVNPEIAPLLLSLISQEQELRNDALLRKAIMLLTLKLAQASRKNLVALAKTDILDILLNWLFPAQHTGLEEGGSGKGKEKEIHNSEEKEPAPFSPSDLAEDERDILTRLVRTILFHGVSTRNIRYIVSRILRQRMSLEEEAKERLNLPLLKLLLDGLRASRWPPFIHFDTSKYPYASVTLPTLANRQFPPFNNNGYSFMGWINVDRFPYSTASVESPFGSSSPQLDVLAVQDEKQICNIRFYIDSTTRTLAFQTGQHAPVQCANTFLEEDRWYHVAVVHHRGSRSTPASITVLLDGRKVEDRIPCPWPTSPDKGTTVSASLGLTRLSAKNQGFLGRESCDTGIWSLGPVWLLDLEVAEEMVFVCYTLGPRYTGNFQDRLGQFQTYQSSTMLNLHLENLYGGSKHAGNSPLVHAIRGKASAYIPETRIYFAFNANNALEAGQADKHPLSARKADNIRSEIDTIASSMSGRIILNAAATDLDNALKSPDSGIASIEGDVTIGAPQSLDLAFDKVGGTPLAGKFVDSAKNSEELEVAINVWEEVFRSSWRMSEDVERSQSYEVLSMILRAKTHLITPNMLKSLLRTCGCDPTDSSRSVISNPLAFRFLLLDFTIWNRVSHLLQILHLEQLSSLVTVSQHKKFNARRLAKMHVIAKMLHAIRCGNVQPALQAAFITCLGTILNSHFRTEEVRQVATFLTATLCTTVEPVHPTFETAHLEQPIFNIQPSQDDPLYQPLMVFQALHDLFFGTEGLSNLAKFANTITTKWTLLFFLEPSTPPLAVVLSLRILARLLRTQSQSYSLKFRNVTDGFRLLRLLLPSFYNVLPVMSTLIYMLTGQDIAALPLDALLESNLLLLHRIKVTENATHILPIILACLKQGLQQLAYSPSTSPPIEYLSNIAELLLATLRSSPELAAVSETHFKEMALLITPLCRLSEQQVLSGPFPLISSLNDFSLPSELVKKDSRSSGLEIEVQTPSPITPNNPEAEAGSGQSKLVELLLECIALSAVHRPGAVLDLLVYPLVGDIKQEITFRTSLIYRILVHLQQADFANWATQTANLVNIFVNDTYAGLVYDVDLLRAVLLAILEEQLACGNHSEKVVQLQKALNRLILFALSADTAALHKATPMLRGFIHHQLTIFSAANTDDTFFRCLTFRLCTLLAASDTEVDVLEREVVIDFFKLLLLQRPAVFAPFNKSPEFISELLQASKEDFVFKLLSDVAVMDQLREAWQTFVQHETNYAVQKLQQDEEGRSNVRTSERSKGESNQRHLITHRTKSRSWATLVTSVETTRFHAARQDFTDHNAFVCNEWEKQQVELIRQLDPTQLADHEIWSLDTTEGPARLRKKLTASIKERTVSQNTKHKPDLSRTFGVAGQPSNSMGVPPEYSPVPYSPVTPIDKEEGIWADFQEPPAPAQQVGRSRAISEPNGDDQLSSEQEDKNRKVLRCLEPGDSVEAVFNTSRIVGLSAKNGLLLLGQRCVYIIDGYQQTHGGEVLDADEIPPEERDKYLETIADLAKVSDRPRSVIPTKDDRHRNRKWAYGEVANIAERKFLFRDVALEIFFSDGRSSLLVFSPGLRGEVVQALFKRAGPSLAVSVGLYTTEPRSASPFGKQVGNPVLRKASKRWEEREISNFEYLMILNSFSGRTYNDITAYPVMPWVVADWESGELDLENPETFRILSLPMGAQTPERRKEFEERYHALTEFNAGIEPAHYLTHFSSAMIVSAFLIRLRPFTDVFLELQGGSFDHADRSFYSWPGAWSSASQLSRSDVRELIPEVYSVPDFLTNTKNKFELGVLQGSDARIDDVILPPWAKGSPSYFIQQHRQALESEFVSQRLHYWVDLVFGYLQRSVEDCNVYQSLSYDGAIDLDHIENEEERAAATATIHSFGQTPRQLFRTAHPPRRTASFKPFELGYFDSFYTHHVPFLNQSAVPLLELDTDVVSIQAPFKASSACAATRAGWLSFPESSTKRLSYANLDGTLRISGFGGSAMLEGYDNEFIAQACFAGEGLLITASRASILNVWKYSPQASEIQFQHIRTLRGHASSVTCLAASKVWSLIVSCDEDGLAILWDLNRLRSVHRLQHTSPIDFCTISESTGEVLTVCNNEFSLFSINGELLARQATHEKIWCCTFSLHDIVPLVATGHGGSKICLWKQVFRENRAPGEPEYGYELVRVLQQHFRFDDRPPAHETRITALAISRAGLYSGDSLGRVALWSLPNGDFSMDDSSASACLLCNTRFGLLEKRLRCMSCGVITCYRDSCSTVLPDIPGKLCLECADAFKAAVETNKSVA